MHPLYGFFLSCLTHEHAVRACGLGWRSGCPQVSPRSAVPQDFGEWLAQADTSQGPVRHVQASLVMHMLAIRMGSRLHTHVQVVIF
jgi:hypothetical protein